eukprot:TRINITY_DN14532_c1_g7_i1.p1 TRINITY_DN14532_c1_g7~~TRINITY_DN14532_c1_g7_i1.p1  ORF type:complete len:1150 (+),score=214.55 TRINITY_DN14532_c1_g7_i1:72-3521(+)
MRPIVVPEPPVLGKVYPRGLVSELIASRPLEATLVSLVVPVALLVAAYSINILSLDRMDCGLESMVISSHESYQKKMRMADLEREWSDTRQRTELSDRVFIQYQADVDILLSDSHLRWVKQVEEGIESIWNGSCFKEHSKPDVCFPMTSVRQYFFAGSVVNLSWVMDGSTNIINDPKPLTKDLLKKNPSWKWFATSPSENIRTQFRLKPGRNSGFWKSFLEHIDYVSHSATAQRKPKSMSLSVGGDGVIPAIICHTISANQWPLGLSALLLFTFLWIVTRSVISASASIVHVVTCYAGALLLYFVTTGQPLVILFHLALYLVVGMTVNGVLIFHKTFAQSGFMPTCGRRNTLTLPQRLAFTYRKAGKGVVSSHVIAVISYLCTRVAPIPALNEFNVVMGYLIAISLLLFLTLHPCLLALQTALAQGLKPKPKTDTAPRQPKTKPKPKTTKSLVSEALLEYQEKALNHGLRVFSDGGSDENVGRTQVVPGPASGLANEMKILVMKMSTPHATTKQHLEEWDNLEENERKRSRRKQPMDAVVRIPAYLTAVGKGTHNEKAMRVEQIKSNIFQRYHRKSDTAYHMSRSLWYNVSSKLGLEYMSTYDTSTSMVSKGAKRAPQMAECLVDSYSPAVKVIDTSDNCGLVGVSTKERHTWLEKMVSARIVPALQQHRFAIGGVYVSVLCAVVGVLTGGVAMRGTPPQMLDSFLMEGYAQGSRLFEVEGGCDHCGAQFQPADTWPVVDEEVIQHCGVGSIHTLWGNCSGCYLPNARPHNCSSECGDHSCGDRGTCAENRGTCVCLTGWSGPSCSIQEPALRPAPVGCDGADATRNNCGQCGEPNRTSCAAPDGIVVDVVLPKESAYLATFGDVCRALLSQPEVDETSDPCFTEGHNMTDATAGDVFMLAKEAGALNDVGFTAPTPSDEGFALDWVRMRFVIQGDERALYKKWDQLAADYGGFQYSDTWIAMYTKDLTSTALKLLIWVGMVVLTAVGGVISQSSRLVFGLAIVIGACTAFYLALLKAIGWDVGPVELIGLACLYATSTECLMHLTVSYQEYLHKAHSSLLAHASTRAQALSVGMKKTVIPVTVSTGLIVAVSGILSLSTFKLYNQLGLLMILNALLTFLHVMVVYPVYLLFLGPVTIITCTLHRGEVS